MREVTLITILKLTCYYVTLLQYISYYNDDKILNKNRYLNNKVPT
jgi:hypothetical protein